METPGEQPSAPDSWWPSLLAVLLFIALLAGAYANGLVLGPGQLAGPDSYMWLYLVETAHDGGSGLLHPLGGMESPRSNAPHGETLHWTWPFFALLYIPAWLGSLLPGVSFADALFAWGVLIGPLLLGASVLVMVWGLQPLLRRGERFIVTLFLLMNAGVLLGFQVARPDHQALSLLLIAVAVAVGVRWTFKPWSVEEVMPKRRTDPYLEVLVAAIVLSLWVSVEGLILVLVFNLGYGLSGLLAGQWQHAMRLAGVMFFSGFLGLILVFFTGDYSLDGVPADTLSDALLYLLMASAFFWAALTAVVGANPIANGLARWHLNLTASILFVSSALLLFFGVGTMMDPYSTMDAEVREIWQQGVVESRPLYASLLDAPGMIVIFLFPALVGLVFCYVQWRAGKPPQRPAWLLLVVGIAVYAAVSFFIQQRFFVQANLLAAGPFALLVWRGFKLADKPMPLMKAFVAGNVFVLLGFLFAVFVDRWRANESLIHERVYALEKAELIGIGKTAYIPEPLPVSAFAAWLNASEAPPAPHGTILAFINIGPELLYRTPHAVVSTPYHRNNEGILDEWTFFTALPENYHKSREMARGRGVTHVLVRPFDPEEEAYYHQEPGPPKQCLWDDLAAGSPPPWLVEIPLPKELQTDYRFYRVRFSD